MKTIGIFGITANPPHAGHVNAAVQAALFCDEVWVSPSYAHAFNKPDMAPYKDRVALTQLVFGDLVPENLKHKIIVSELDKACFDKNQKTPIYTYDLMRFIKTIVPSTTQLVAIFGADSEAVIDKYYEAEKLQAEYKIFYAKEEKSTHSTTVRAQLKHTKKLTDNDSQDLKKILGHSAFEYFSKHQLYNLNSQKDLYERKNVFQR